jgi:hypothetical protein
VGEFIFRQHLFNSAVYAPGEQHGSAELWPPRTPAEKELERERLRYIVP